MNHQEIKSILDLTEENEECTFAYLESIFFFDNLNKVRELVQLINNLSYLQRVKSTALRYLLDDIAWKAQSIKYRKIFPIIQNIRILSEDWFCKNEIADLVRDDNITGLQSLNIKKDFLLPKPFNRSVFSNIEIPLICFAAFCGSVQCFRYLAYNFPNLSELIIYGEDLDFPLGVGEFAVAGGNYEVIHIIEDYDVCIPYALFISVKFFRNDLVEWFLDNPLCRKVTPKRICLIDFAKEVGNEEAVEILCQNVN